MNVRFFDDPGIFNEHVEPYLLQHEAHHNLFFGILHTLIHDPQRYPRAYMFTVEDSAGSVSAVALMTLPHNLIVSKVVDKDVLVLLADALAERNIPVPGVLGPEEEAGIFAQAWQQKTGQSYKRLVAQRIYELTEVEPVQGVPGELRRAAATDRDLLVHWVNAFIQEALDGVAEDAETLVENHLSRGALYIWQDNEPVSMAVGHGPTPRGIRVSYVYTPPEHRRKGYASACVAALSQKFLDEGREFCFLFTDLSNPTSNHIYQAIGYRPVCDVDLYQFELA